MAMDIPNYELNEWLQVLKPDQSEKIKQLVKNVGVEKAVDEWLLNGESLPITKSFGDDKNDKKDLYKVIENYKNEITKFICGHPDYDELREEFKKITESAKEFLISSLSAIIGFKLAIPASILAPAIILSIYGACKMGVNIYCSAHGYKNEELEEELN